MRLRSIIALTAITLLSLVPAIAQERFLQPVDEGPQDASFKAFRDKALKATAAKDAAYIRSIIAKDISVDFGGGGGTADFLKAWKNLSKTSSFWSEFQFVLSHGGEFQKMKNRGPKSFWAPYIFTSFPEDLDAFEFAAIAGDNVRLRKTPDAKGLIIAHLSYNIVKPDYLGSPEPADPKQDPEWIKVETVGGMKGYVSSEFVRSPIGYRACFTKIGNNWKLTAFVAGD